MSEYTKSKPNVIWRWKKSKKRRGGVKICRNILKLSKIEYGDQKSKKGRGGVKICWNILKLSQM